MVALSVLVGHMSLPSGFLGSTSVQDRKMLFSPVSLLANGKMQGLTSPVRCSKTWQPIGQLDSQLPQFPSRCWPFSSTFVEHHRVTSDPVPSSHLHEWYVVPSNRNGKTHGKFGVFPLMVEQFTPGTDWMFYKTNNMNLKNLSKVPDVYW